MNYVPSISKDAPELGFKIKSYFEAMKVCCGLPHNVWGKFAHSEVLF